MNVNDLPVGATLQSYPIDAMIVSLARGIARAQFEMDNEAIAVLKSRASELLEKTPGDPSSDSKSLLELGLLPSFFKFETTTIEVAIELSMRVEEDMSIGLSASVDASRENSGGGDDTSDDGGGEKKSSVAFGASITADYSRKYGVEMTGATRVSATISAQNPPAAMLEFFTS